jgi:Protein of unknown function with PCYCGC motif
MSCLLVSALVLSACQQPASTPTTSAPAGGTDHSAHAGHSPAAVATPRVPDFFPDLAAARPLPKTLSPDQFSSPYVKAAYKIAIDYPDVLAQQPCYCYCDTGFGHKSLLDCHIDMHSAECMVCMKEAILAGKLHQEGKNAAQIRESIIKGDWQNVPLQ